MPGAEVRRNQDRSRYELTMDGRVVGIADYHEAGPAIVLPHTEIASSLRGRGFGAQLVRGALDDVRDRGRTVVPRCWYVAQFIREHPEYAELVA
jgi:uncharacterized protein